MSGGRIEVGVGAGWNDLEHRQLGLPFPPIDERADLLEDQLAILHGLWGEPDGWSYDGHDGHDRGRPVLPEAGRRAGPAATGRTAPRGRGSSSAAAGLAARRAGSPRAGADEFNLIVRRPTRRRGELRRARRGVPRDRARSGDARPLDDGRRPDRARPSDEVASARGGAARGVRRRTPTARTGSRSAASAGSSGRRTTARAHGPRASPTAGVERIMLQDFIPWDLDHDRRDGRGARRAGLGAVGVRPVRRGPASAVSVGGVRRGHVDAGRRAGSGPGPSRARGRAARSGAGAASRVADERGDRRRQVRRLRRRASRPAGVSVDRARRRGRRPGSPPTRMPDARGPRASAWRARASALGTARRGRSRIEDEAGRRRRSPARWPWQERLEVAVGRRQPRCLLDLERPARGPPAGRRRRRCTMRCAASAKRPAMPLGAGLVARARRRGSRRRSRRRADARTDAPPTAAPRRRSG